MPNWCTTIYRVKGNKKSINSFKTKLNRIVEYEDNYGMGVYIGDFFNEFNARQYNEIFKAFVPKDDYNSIDDNTYEFRVTSAYRMIDEIEEVINIYFPSLSVYYVEYESGNEIFNTNDYDNVAFTPDEMSYFERYECDDYEDIDDYEEYEDDDEFETTSVDLYSSPIFAELCKIVSGQYSKM